MQLHPGRLRLDFTQVTDPRWRQVAKEYIFARLAPAHPAVAVLPGAYRMPLTLQTCRRRMPELAGWLNWLTSQQVPALEDVTQDHCDRYLAERRRRTDNAGQVAGALSAGTLQAVAAVIIELGAYAELFTADRYHDGFTPWQGRTASQVAGFRSGGENKTTPVDQQLLQPLLAAAFYVIGALGPHVLALRDSVRNARLARAGPRTARAACAARWPSNWPTGPAGFSPPRSTSNMSAPAQQRAILPGREERRPGCWPRSGKQKPAGTWT